MKTTSSLDCDASREQILWALWSKTVDAEENTKFLSRLSKLGIGTGEMEAVILRQLKVKKSSDKYKRRDELLKILFKEKLDDAKTWEGEKRRKRNKTRKEIEDKLGVKTRKLNRTQGALESPKLKRNSKLELKNGYREKMAYLAVLAASK